MLVFVHTACHPFFPHLMSPFATKFIDFFFLPFLCYQKNICIFISFSTGLFEQLDERIDMKKKERKEREEIKYFKINL